MQEMLQSRFDDNVQKIRRKRVFGYDEGKLNLVVLSGDTGIGKTACVKEFAKKKGFKLITMFCDEPDTANLLAINLNNAINTIDTKGKQHGFVLLLDNIDRIDKATLEIIDQYRANYLKTFMRVAKPRDGKDLNTLEYVKLEVQYDSIPENIFIVGEQRPH